MLGRVPGNHLASARVEVSAQQPRVKLSGILSTRKLTALLSFLLNPGDGARRASPESITVHARMTPEAIRLCAVPSDSGACINRLRVIANEMHRDLGVSAGMRAVMESLAERLQRVPQLARA